MLTRNPLAQLTKLNMLLQILSLCQRFASLKVWTSDLVELTAELMARQSAIEQDLFALREETASHLQVSKQLSHAFVCRFELQYFAAQRAWDLLGQLNLLGKSRVLGHRPTLIICALFATLTRLLFTGFELLGLSGDVV